jgi:beta-lactam-binding protein with PASTA domain
MITLILILLLVAVAGVLFQHFSWASFHKAEIDAKDVIIDRAQQAEAFARIKLAELEAKFNSKPSSNTLKPLPTPPPIPNSPAPSP